MNDFDHNLWGKIVPDGPQFCCWGGKRLIKPILKKLDIKPSDKVLDLCCGQGGMADYFNKTRLYVGIDLSKEAINQAESLSGNPRAIFIRANAHPLPFADQSFNKVLSRDADIFMRHDKDKIMQEINRVLVPDGLFVWQSYATKENPMHDKTRGVLRNVGYSKHDMPYLPKIRAMFTRNGFSILNFHSLHKIYAEDNLRMISRAKKIGAPPTLMDLLEWESELFRKMLWTGVLVTSMKAQY